MPNKNTDNPFRSMQKSGRSRGPYGRGGYPPAGQAARAGAVSPGFAALAARGANARPGAVSRGLSSLAARGANALAARGANARAGSASSQFAEREARRATEGPEMQARERERAASRTRGPGMNPFMSRMLLQQLGTATAAPETAGPVTDPFPSQGDLSRSLPMDGPPSSGPLGPGSGPISGPMFPDPGPIIRDGPRFPSGPIDTPILNPPTDSRRSTPVTDMKNLPGRASGAPPGMVEVSSNISGEPIYDYPENAWRYEGIYT
jgi:hypothetical protein